MFNYKRLILARMRRRLTGKALAQAAGLSAITVSRLENGENQPDDETMVKLARALAENSARVVLVGLGSGNDAFKAISSDPSAPEADRQDDATDQPK